MDEPSGAQSVEGETRTYGLDKLQPSINDCIGWRISVSKWPVLVSCSIDQVPARLPVGRTWNSMPILTIAALS
jgi:hypothetical protein